MRVVIVGGGKVGSYLARELRQQRHSVVLIEKDRSRALAVHEDTGALALCGDGTDVRILREAETDRADIFVAVTGKDEDNLVACQLARTTFSTPQVLARLNDPRNRRTFAAMDVPVVSVTDLIVQVISREVDVKQLTRVALIGRGDVSILEVEIPDDVPVRLVPEVRLPEHTILIAIHRGDEVIIPGPRSEIRPGDRVLAVTMTHLEDEVRDALTAPDTGGAWIDTPPVAGAEEVTMGGESDA